MRSEIRQLRFLLVRGRSLKAAFARILPVLLLFVTLHVTAQTREENLAAARQNYDEAMALYKKQDLISLQTAREKLLTASRLFGENGEKKGTAMSLVWAGLISNNLGERRLALDYNERALSYFQQLGDKTAEALTLNNIGQNYSDLSEKQKALSYFNRALPIVQELGLKRSEGLVLNNIGLIYSDTGEYGQALDYYNRALPLRRAGDDRRGEAVTLNNLGKVYSSIGEEQKALEYYRQSLEIRREVEDKAGEAQTLYNIGQVYGDLNENRKGLEYFEQALSLYRFIGDKSGEAYTLGGIGRIYITLDEHQKALDYLNHALPLMQETEDKAGESLTLNNLGLAYYNSGQLLKALEHYIKSLSRSRAIGNREGEATTLNNLGGILLESNKARGALDYYDQALPLLRVIGDKSGEATVLHNMMFAWEMLENRKLAVFYGKQSVNLHQQLRSNIKDLPRSTQQAFLRSVEDTYRYLADILISDGRFGEAQAVLELIKAKEYEQLLRNDEKGGTIPYNNAESDLAARIDALVALRRTQTELLKQKETQGGEFPAERQMQLTGVEAEIKKKAAEFENVLGKLARADTSDIAEISGEKSLRAALSQLEGELRTGTVALYTVIGTRDEKETAPGNSSEKTTVSRFGWVIMVTPNDKRAYPIDVADLEETVYQFRAALSSYKYDPRPLAEKLYTAIFRQKSDKQKTTLEQDLAEILGKYPEKNLMWSLDGVLRYIPVAALYDGKKYLVEKYENIVFTSESLPWLLNRSPAKIQALGLGVSDGNLGLELGPLPGVRRELSDIIRQTGETTGILSGIRKLNAQFNKREIENLRSENNQFQVVHIASHYSFNPTDQNASFLLVGDGKLTFGELKAEQKLFEKVDLLTLSACDTAMSANGKESEGFAFLAQRLGAKSVLASLWQISDVGTPKLMVGFYKLRAENPDISKGEAFRRAQLSLLSGGKAGEAPAGPVNRSTAGRTETVKIGGRLVELPLFERDPKNPFAHPFYWASFVLIGNWR